ncbi:MAG TPA: DUF1360 domain-containing protein [Armatimonadota bacterium]|nr:DUF1360 domain-containing protein [Armatimonadota bacterium]
MLHAVFLVTYLAFWALFLLLRHALGVSWPGTVSGMDLLLLSMATFRITEVITEEKIARFLRAPFCKKVLVTKPDGTQEEEEVPSGSGLRRVAGELILCPWCAGIWVGTLLTFAWVLFPSVARVVILAFAVAAGGLAFQIFTKLMDRGRKALPEE